MWRPRPVTTLTCPVARSALGHERVHERRLADAGVPDEHRRVADERRADPLEGHLVLRAREDLEVEALEVREELGRVGEVGLGHDEQRADAGIQRRDEVAVDEPLARLRIGGGHDDEHLVGVGDDDPLDLVGVVGAAPQQRRALLDADDAGERALVAGTSRRRRARDRP